MSDGREKVTLNVNVRREAGDERQQADLVVYAFDNTGRFLASRPAPKGAGGVVKLEFPSEFAGASVRVVVGPARVKEEHEIPPWMARLLPPDEAPNETPRMAALARRGAFEKHVRLAATGTAIDTTILPAGYAFLRSCTVRGRVLKRVPLPDGTTREFGVCHACVKIYEVDSYPKFIVALPDYDLVRLRDDLWKFYQELPPQPPREYVPRPPRPDPVGAATLLKSPTLPLPPPAPAATRAATPLDTVFTAGSISQLRSALLNTASIVVAHLCHLSWTWSWFHKDFIKCCCTDEQGRFETTIWYWAAGDVPDLYFKAVQCIGGHLHTLYDPGVACHTWWNYVCGTEVSLETHDPAAITCAPSDPIQPPVGVSQWVMPWAVGGIRLDQIRSDPANPSMLGLTDFTDGTGGTGTWADVPFGSTLGFRHGYSSSIPFAAAGKPALYRWQYNKLDGSYHETEWRDFASPVAATVVRHYVDYDLAHPELPPTFPAYPLGPQEKNSMHLYEFRPHEPPGLPGHKREWPVDNWFDDIYSGILLSENLPGGVTAAAGIYKMKLEVFDVSGVLVTPGPGTFDFIVPIGLAGDGLTVLTRKALAAEIEDGGFVFYVHIDNNRCQAVIYEAKIGDVAAGPCGFIAYAPGDDVRLSFKAAHPNGFARYIFTVVRGSSGRVAAACAPDPAVALWSQAPLVTTSAVNGFTRDPSSVYAKNVDEADMRGGCPKAAFGEDLYVSATATNGWVRLSGLDASAVPMAFALEPKT